MPDTKTYRTRVTYRYKRDNKVLHLTFRGANHAVKATAFVVRNKREFDHHVIETL